MSWFDDWRFAAIVALLLTGIGVATAIRLDAVVGLILILGGEILAFWSGVLARR